jgi:hypothetical protein
MVLADFPISSLEIPFEDVVLPPRPHRSVLLLLIGVHSEEVLHLMHIGPKGSTTPYLRYIPRLKGQNTNYEVETCMIATQVGDELLINLHMA